MFQVPKQILSSLAGCNSVLALLTHFAFLKVYFQNKTKQKQIKFFYNFPQSTFCILTFSEGNPFFCFIVRNYFATRLVS